MKTVSEEFHGNFARGRGRDRSRWGAKRIGGDTGERVESRKKEKGVGQEREISERQEKRQVETGERDEAKEERKRDRI
jgi:hypothetical protein